jgi:hypothetical protein
MDEYVRIQHTNMAKIVERMAYFQVWIDHPSKLGTMMENVCWAEIPMHQEALLDGELWCGASR